MPSPEHEQIVAMLLDRPPQENLSMAEQRQGFEAVAQMFPLPDDVQVQSLEIAQRFNADWVSVPESASDRAVLYLHGGGYVIGSNTTHRELAGRVARAARARVLVINYRLAPEHPFPAAVEDATEAYRWLLDQGVAPQRITVAGDSAGGGLALATLLALKEADDALPACAVCLSPWIDLEGTGASAQPGAVDDPMITADGLRETGLQYAPQDIRHPLAAPLYGNYTGLPPLLIQVGTREVLLDDARRAADKARAAGVDVTLEEEEGLIHVWQMFGPDMPEAATALEHIGAFIRAHTP
jgi:acetyl esterase/lipase